MTKVEDVKKIGITPGDWVLLTAEISLTNISGLHKDGRFFMDNTHVSTSIDLLELTKTRSHIHKVDGDVGMEITRLATRFFEVPNVERLYHYKEGDLDFIMAVLSEDYDEVAFHLATIKIDIQDKFPNIYFEIRYVPKSHFSISRIPVDSKEIVRG